MTFVIVVFFCGATGLCTQGSLANNVVQYDTSDACWAAIQAKGRITTSTGDQAFLACQPESAPLPIMPGSRVLMASPSQGAIP